MTHEPINTPNTFENSTISSVSQYSNQLHFEDASQVHFLIGHDLLRIIKRHGVSYMVLDVDDGRRILVPVIIEPEVLK